MSSISSNPHADEYMYQQLKRALHKIEFNLYFDILQNHGSLGAFARCDEGYRKFVTAPTGVIEGNPAYKSIQKKIREKNYETKNVHQEFAFFHLDNGGSYGRKKFGTKFLNKIHQAGHLEQLVPQFSYAKLLESTERVPLPHEKDPLKQLLCNYYVYPIFETTSDGEVKFLSPPESGYAFFKAWLRKQNYKYGRYGVNGEPYGLFLEMCAKIRYVKKQFGAVEAMKVFVDDYYPYLIEKGTGQEVTLSDEEYDELSTLFAAMRQHFHSEMTSTQTSTQASTLSLKIKKKKSRHNPRLQRSVMNQEIYWV